MLAIDPIAESQGAINVVQGSISNTTGFIADVEGSVGISTTAATSAATQAQHYALTMWDYLKQMAIFAKQQATNLAIGSANIAKQTLVQAENRLGQVAMATANEAKTVYREGKVLSALVKTLKFIYRMIKKVWPVLKWLWFCAILMHGIGIWGLRTIEVLIYRIFHIKDCFLWYTLEIIGFILYVPIEFVVWLLCLQSIEKSVWKLVEDLDCFLTGLLGFHVFHYSDTVLKKCYSKRFPPFPYKAVKFDGDMEFTEEQFVKFVVDWFMPPSPQEIGEAISVTVNALDEHSGLITGAAGAVGGKIADMFKISPPDPDGLKNALGDLVAI